VAAATLERMDMKLFVDDPAAVKWSEWTSYFTEWLKESPDEWLDIADYLHVPSGPGILLVGKRCHVAMDNRRGQPGMLFSLREPFAGSNRERIVAFLRQLSEFAARIERDKPAVRFRRDLGEFAVNDRVGFPNTPEAFDAIADDLRSAVQEAFGVDNARLSRDEDRRQRLTVRVTVPG